MVRALATAQVQSVREITKKADIKKANKKITIFVLAFFISLIVLFISYNIYTYYLENKYEFKENESGIDFYSKELPIKEGLGQILDKQNILMSVNIYEKDINKTLEITEVVILLNSILVSKNKNVITQINIVDSKENILNCTTNKGDIYTNETISKEECTEIINNSEATIFFDLPDETRETSIVYLYPFSNRIEIRSKNRDQLFISVYLILKSKYSDLEKTLLEIEEIKKIIGEKISSDINSSNPSN